MSIETERLTIEKHLRANWSQTKIAFENVKFDKPSDSKWISLTINNGSSSQITMGSSTPLNRHLGLISIQVFTPAGIGTKQAKEMARDVADIFRRRTFNISATETLLCREPNIQRVGVESDTGLYNLLVTIPFWRDIYN